MRNKNGKIEKLERLILHPNTPPSEKEAAKAALDRLLSGTTSTDSQRAAFKGYKASTGETVAPCPKPSGISTAEQMASRRVREEMAKSIRLRGVSYEGLVPPKRPSRIRTTTTPAYSQPSGCMFIGWAFVHIINCMA